MFKTSRCVIMMIFNTKEKCVFTSTFRAIWWMVMKGAFFFSIHYYLPLLYLEPFRLNSWTNWSLCFWDNFYSFNSRNKWCNKKKITHWALPKSSTFYWYTFNMNSFICVPEWSKRDSQGALFWILKQITCDEAFTGFVLPLCLFWKKPYSWHYEIHAAVTPWFWHPARDAFHISIHISQIY